MGVSLFLVIFLNKLTPSHSLEFLHFFDCASHQLQQGRTIEEVALDRARGYTCSQNDPVTGGKHCAIGGGATDFLVTSTLASQAPPAVGRALGFALSQKLGVQPCRFPRDAVSFVSLGEGSLNNAHFLAAENLARNAQFNGVKCPVVFAVSDNGLCISLRNNGWAQEMVDSRSQDSGSSGIRTFQVDGNDTDALSAVARKAVAYSRRQQRPSILYMHSLARRFGHAGSDRQAAYLSEEEIASAADFNALLGLVATSARPVGEDAEIVRTSGQGDGTNTLSGLTLDQISARFDHIVSLVEEAFEGAMNEPKIQDLDALVASNAAASVLPTAALAQNESITARLFPWVGESGAKRRGQVMRKHMNAVLDEMLSSGSNKGENGVVYIGEDVEHGGYYLVTEGLAKKFPGRVRDFPPDETTLLGAGAGMAQVGLTPIVEIPYAKYLDCGADSFFELVISHWLSNGSQANGMVIRLQGFDKGVFGGNFHTHNMLHLPPGLDVVCYSNGADYARGMRHCLRQARAGRVVMSVDSTDLLNRRHLDASARDDGWIAKYPGSEEELTFDHVIVYSSELNGKGNQDTNYSTDVALAIVTYGNGVPSALLAARHLSEQPSISQGGSVVVIDAPYLSAIPAGLRNFIINNSGSFGKVRNILFADVCKEGPGMPLGAHATTLHSEGALDHCSWATVGAARTYNPLGSTLTFLSEDSIVAAAEHLLSRSRCD
jgi:2-oxoisovalerate dehydrogenase E1 component